MRTILRGYEQAATEPLTASPFDPPARQERVQQAMIRVESSCAQPAVVIVRYPPSKDRDVTRPMALAPGARAFVPVYAMDSPNGESERFIGVEGPACIHASRVRGIDRLLWMDATLNPGWTATPLYQRVYLGPAFPERLWLKIAHWWPKFATLG